MKKGMILLFMVLSGITSISAGEMSSLYASLRDDMYNQGTTSPDIHSQIESAVKLVDTMVSDRAENLFWKARFEYISGRVYMEKDMASKKNFEKFRSDEAVIHFEKAYDLLDESLNLKEDSEALTLRADILGQLCLLKGQTFTVANGLDIRRMTERAIELDPQNGKAWVLMGNDRVYTPKIFGGSPRDGIKLFEKAESMPNVERDDLFNIYSGIGVAWKKEKKKDLARFWMNKALIIYPENIYIQRMMDDL